MYVGVMTSKNITKDQLDLIRRLRNLKQNTVWLRIFIKKKLRLEN